MYDSGQGATQSDKEASKWYSKAAEQGHSEAKHNLKALYEKRKGVLKSCKEALDSLPKL